MRSTTSQKWRRSGANLALFAMLALWISPALAWMCCCHQEVVPALQKVAQQARPAAHSCCPQPAKTAQLSAPHDCNCKTAQSTVVTQAEAPGAFSFAPIAVTVSRVEFPLGTLPEGRAIYTGLHEARPRGPDPCLRSGRAPPVFSA